MMNLLKGEDWLVDKKYKEESKSNKMRKKRMEKEIEKVRIVHRNLD